MESIACAMSSADRRGRALEQHVLDEMGDATALGGLVPGASRQPDADTDGPDLRHPLGEKTKAIIENVSNDQRVRQGKLAAGRRFGGR